MRYYKPRAGEWISPVKRGYKMQCCDCGLVHRLDFNVSKNGKVRFRVYRNDRATSLARRGRLGVFGQGIFVRRAVRALKKAGVWW